MSHSSRTRRDDFRPDPRSAWPAFKHDHEGGGGRFDCETCGSPRIFKADNDRICASCGRVQKPLTKCQGCGTQLYNRGADSQTGLCRSCRRRDDTLSAAPE